FECHCKRAFLKVVCQQMYETGDLGKLVVIGSNPPLGTSGNRTRRRVELAGEVLEYSDVELVNIFELASCRTGEITRIGENKCGWLRAREVIRVSLQTADGIMVAYGLQPPSGAARLNFSEQVEWLWHKFRRLELPVWNVGGAPRHPSRWQRYTNKHYPELQFAEALKNSFTRASN